MQVLPVVTADARRRSTARDLLLALLVAAFLSFAWARNDWANLSRLVLPDPDDMARLAQIRDWLAGQAANDWTQYRTAPPHGAPMHWSRINDLFPTGVILAATPIVGRYGAELAAVLLYPALLFACCLFLGARIARRLWGPEAAPVAIILGALAFPGTTIFVPGRIDHHALQTALVLAAVLALSRRPNARNGAAAGLATAISLGVGLETAPQFVALTLVLFALWVRDGAVERDRLAAFAAALGGVTVAMLGVMKPTFWSSTYCDAFTPASTAATLAGSAGLALLAGLTPRLHGRRGRLLVGAGIGAAALGVALQLYPACIRGPYGAVHPIIRDEFLANVGEAIGPFQQGAPARAVAMGGLLATACAVAIWMLMRERLRWRTTAPVAAVVLMSGLVVLAQVRGAYVGASAAAPVLAGMVVAARRRTTGRLPALLAAWIAAAGLTYKEVPPRIARLLAPNMPVEPDRTPQTVCSAGDAWRQIDRLTPGRVMAPAYLSAFLIGATRMSTVGSGYHRSDAGNVAMYRYFIGPAADAPAIARAWGVRYVAFCPGDFEEIEVRRRFPDSVAAMLARGETPPGLQRLRLRGTPLRFYRVED